MADNLTYKGIEYLLSHGKEDFDAEIVLVDDRHNEELARFEVTAHVNIEGQKVKVRYEPDHFYCHKGDPVTNPLIEIQLADGLVFSQSRMRVVVCNGDSISLTGNG